MKNNKENKKTSIEGIAHIQSSFEHVIIVITDKDHNAISWSSAPIKRYKAEEEAFPEVVKSVEECSKVAIDAGIKSVKVVVKGPGKSREAAMKALQRAGLEITAIIDKTPIPHNGCRPPKSRVFSNKTNNVDNQSKPKTKNITITEEQRNNLCRELARLTFEFRKDKNVQCIYFKPHTNLDTAENILEVTVIKDNCEYKNDELKEYNREHQDQNAIQEYGLKIVLSSRDPKSISGNNLMNATILYDENGKLTQIKEQNSCNNNGALNDNRVEIVPPLDEALDRALDAARMERDTEAVHDFTKSIMFQEFMRMPQSQECLYISEKTLITLAILGSENSNGVTYKELNNVEEQLKDELRRIFSDGYININYPDTRFNSYKPEFEKSFDRWNFNSQLLYDNENRQKFIENVLNFLKQNLIRYGLSESEAQKIIDSLTAKTVEDSPKKHTLNYK